MSTHTHEKESQAARLLVPDGFSPEDVKDLSSVLNALVIDCTSCLDLNVASCAVLR
jgi:hypothetical protein